MYDEIKEVPHYNSGGIETWDYQKAKSTPEEFRGYLRLTAMKYLSRAGKKPGQSEVKDYQKAVEFLNKLIKEIESDGK